VRRTIVGVISLVGSFLAVAGCTQQEKRMLSHLPDPIQYNQLMKPKPESPPLPKVVIPKLPGRPSIYSEPGWMPAGGISNRWECIVIHHSDSPNGNAASFDQWHRQRGWDELGYHFVIDNGSGGPDGRVEVGSRWDKQKHGAHCKVPGNYYNEHGIGICLVGDFEKAHPTARQIDSLKKLLAFLMAETHIPPSHILGHGEANGGKTRCPGRNMPLAQLRNGAGYGRVVAFVK
jgi:hypothetical protein